MKSQFSHPQLVFYLLPLLIVLPTLQLGQHCRTKKIPSSLHEENILESHWYLFLLVVHPNYQRKGYGTLLVKEMFRLTESDKCPYWVDTQKEENVNYFEKFGFKLVEVGKIPESDIKH